MLKCTALKIPKDTDNSTMVTRGKELGVIKDKGGQKYGDIGLILGGGHTMQSTDHVS